MPLGEDTAHRCIVIVISTVGTAGHNFGDEDSFTSQFEGRRPHQAVIGRFLDAIKTQLC